MAIVNSIYGLAFLVHLAFDSVTVFGRSSITELQCNSCKQGSADYAVYIFFKHFLGELLPITAVLIMQLVTFSVKDAGEHFLADASEESRRSVLLSTGDPSSPQHQLRLDRRYP